MDCSNTCCLGLSPTSVSMSALCGCLFYLHVMESGVCLHRGHKNDAHLFFFLPGSPNTYNVLIPNYL